MSAAELHAALAEILRRGAAIIVGERLVGGPRAVAFDLAGVAAKALGVEFRGPPPVEQRTWLTPEEQEILAQRCKRRGGAAR
jgi:hypothetical protein